MTMHGMNNIKPVINYFGRSAKFFLAGKKGQ
jgi:hypothetical protein